MAGFCWSFKEGQGVHIEGDGTIDATVRRILGSGPQRRVQLDVQSDEGKESRLLEPHADVEVAPGVRVKLLHPSHVGRRAYFSCFMDGEPSYAFY